MAARDCKFNFVMTEEEKRWLEVIAEADNRTAGGWLRAAIKRAYDELQSRYDEIDRRLSETGLRRDVSRAGTGPKSRRGKGGKR